MKGQSAMAEQQANEGSGLRGVTEQAVELLDEAECLRLTAAGGVGRIGYTSRFGPVVLPVNYELHEGTIVFRTGLHSSMVEDLRTGIATRSTTLPSR
jgi:nitroimidazol reductase NimA-like FMN-containing flavoprotein (pyridoxamine 5'-phosphate oxidase superfamily)